MTDKTTTSHDLIQALAAHAKTLGWEISEFEWQDDDQEGHAEYRVYVHQLDGGALR